MRFTLTTETSSYEIEAQSIPAVGEKVAFYDEIYIVDEVQYFIEESINSTDRVLAAEIIVAYCVVFQSAIATPAEVPSTDDEFADLTDWS